jgi:two-component sensor histidine kinase
VQAQSANGIDATTVSSRSGMSDADSPDAPPLLVSDATPTAAQRKAAWGIVIVLCVTFIAVTPYFYVQLAIFPAFVPVVHFVVFITSLIAAAFLFSQFVVQPRPAFLALASGYLSAGLFAFFQSLAFPNAYSATGLFGGTSTAAWLFLLWRTAFPMGIIAYALLRRSATASSPDRHAIVPIAITIGCAVIVACSLTWVVTIAEPHLPPLFTDATHESLFGTFTVIPSAALSLMGILLLVRGRRTVLDLWLIVTLITALPDVIIPVTRFMLGFYLARGCELISSCAILIALLTEAATLYARLASAKVLQAQEMQKRARTEQLLRDSVENQRVLVAELQHRTRNIIAVVQSIAEQSAENTSSAGSFLEGFNRRLSALSRVQSLLSRSDAERITVGALVRMELEAIGFSGMSDRISLSGPELRLPNAVVQTLALVLHELTTNALKHGSLGRETGTLDVVWHLRLDPDRHLVLEWKERGLQLSPQQQVFAHRGQGSELIEEALPYTLGARTSLKLEESGLVCVIDLPLDKTPRKLDLSPDT